MQIFWIFTQLSVSFLASASLFPVALRYAHLKGYVIRPDQRRRHPCPTPHVGGMVIAASIAVTFLVMAVFHSAWIVSSKSELLALALGSILLLGVGWIDDRRGLNANQKLTVQFAAAIIGICLNPSIRHFTELFEPTFGFLIYPLVCIWIVGLTNAFNLIDGLDGLAGGTALSLFGGFFLLQVVHGHGTSPTSLLALTVIGSVIGFLKYNFAPAKVFLGDSGSLLLGYLIACMSLSSVSPDQTWQTTIGLVVALGYPILDMGLCSWRRFRAGRSLFQADRNHLHYRLKNLGFSVPAVAIGLSAFAAIFQLSGVAIYQSSAVGATLTLLSLSIFVTMSILFLDKVETLLTNKESIEDFPGVSRTNIVRPTSFDRESIEQPIFSEHFKVAQQENLVSTAYSRSD